MLHFQHETTKETTPRRSRRASILAAAVLACATLAATPWLFAGAGDSASPRHLYMDVHRLGPGNVTLDAVADAHTKDLAIQDEYDVDYQRYWVDEASGTIYCLLEAPSAEAANEVHRHAHGLVADEVAPMRAGILPAEASGDRKLFMDTHEVGPGVRGEDVAEAHLKDLAVQGEFDTRFLEYWVDEADGKIHCLAEAPSQDAVISAHAKAHGLVPDEIYEVAPGH